MSTTSTAQDANTQRDWPDISTPPTVTLAVVKAGVRIPLRAEEDQAEPDQHVMHGHAEDQQRQHRGARDRGVGDAVEMRAERGHDRDGEHAEQRGPGMARDEDQREPGQHRRGPEPAEQEHERRAPHRAGPDDVPSRADQRERIEQPQRAGHVAGKQEGEGERAIGDEIALRDEDDAGDREDQQQPEREKQVDRARGQPVLQKQEEDLRVHRWSGEAAACDAQLGISFHAPFCT